MWCLARLLPLFIGKFIPSADPHWENYLLMMTIVDYAFGPVTSHDAVPYLKTIIQEHHEEFCNLWHSRRKSTFRRKNTKMSYLYHVVALTLLYLLVLVVLESVLLFPSYKGKRVDH